MCTFHEHYLVHMNRFAKGGKEHTAHANTFHVTQTDRELPVQELLRKGKQLFEV